MYLHAINNKNINGIFNCVAPKPVANKNLIKTKISKQDICDFYINLLRKLELIRFTLNFSELNQSENKFNNRSF